MIRRDYIVEIIEEFGRRLRRIAGFRKEGKGGEAQAEADATAQLLAGGPVASLLPLSRTELMARVMRGGSQGTHEKILILIALLKEAGDLAAHEEQSATAYYHKALQLALDTATREAGLSWPEFVPTIELLRSLIGSEALPLNTQALLMHHYELSGQFGRAMSVFSEMMAANPRTPGLAELGRAFYRRLLAKTDIELANGEVNRELVETELGRV